MKKPKLYRPKYLKQESTKSGVNAYAPLYKSMTYINKRVFPVTQRAAINLAYTPAVGLAGTSFDICFGLTQSSADYCLNNNPWNSTVFSNYTNLANLFQEYRIIRLDVTVFFSNNSANNAAGSTTGNALPIVYCIEDREDASAVNTVSGMLQYASCKVYQMGDTKGHTKTLKYPSAFAAYDNDSTFIGTLSAAGVKRSPWLACGSNSNTNVAPSIPHGYVKMLIDPCGNTNTVSSGTFTFIITGLYEFRGID